MSYKIEDEQGRTIGRIVSEGTSSKDAIDPVTGTLIAFGLFAVVGVLFFLLSGGGLGMIGGWLFKFEQSWWLWAFIGFMVLTVSWELVKDKLRARR